MARYQSKNLIQIIAMTLLLVTGCGKPPQQKGQATISDLAPENSTGATVRSTSETQLGGLEVDLPYTTAGAEDLFNQIRNEIGPQSDSELAKLIVNVLSDAQLPKIKIVIQFKPQAQITGNILEFNGVLSQQNETWIGRDIELNSESLRYQRQKYKLDVKCYDSCKILDLRLKKFDLTNSNAESPAPKTTGILYRKSKPKITMRYDEENSESAKDPMITDLKQSLNVQAELNTVTVVDGPSLANLSTPNGFHTQAVLADTNKGPTVDGKTQIDGKTSTESTVIGVDPHEGSFVLNIKNPDPKHEAINAVLVVENEPLPKELQKKEVTPAPESKPGKGGPKPAPAPGPAQPAPTPGPAQPAPAPVPAQPAPAPVPAQPAQPTPAPAPVPAQPTQPTPTPAPVPAQPTQPTPTPAPVPAQPTQPTPAPAPVPAQPAPTPVPSTDPKTQTEPRMSLFNPLNNQGPRSKKIREQFRRYEESPHVKVMIDVWLGKRSKPYSCTTKVIDKKTNSERFVPIYSVTPSRTRLVNFIKNISPLTESIERVTAANDVPSEISYILSWESEYAMDGNYNTTILTTDLRSTALGPWQLTDSATKDILKFSQLDFNYSKIDSSRKPNLRDDRTFFLNSTYMASFYFDYLFKENRHDPAVAVLAYYTGQGGAQDAMGWNNGYKNTFLTLDEIIKFRVRLNQGDGRNCQGAIYALSFLSANAIGQNLSKYGLDKIKPTDSSKFLERLKNPNGPLPAGI